MFRRSPRLRAFATRCCLLAFAIGPAVGFAALGIERALPHHVRQVEATIKAEWGVDCQLAAVQHPFPGQMVLQGVRLHDPETGQKLASIETLRCAWPGGSQVLVASGLRCEHATLATRVGPWVERVLALRPRQPGQTVRFNAPDLTIQMADQSEKRVRAVARMESHDAGPQLVFEWQPEDAVTTRPVRCTVFRDRRDGAPQTGFELDTGDNLVELAWLEPALPLTGWVGARAAFGGYLWARRRGEHWQGTATGELRGIDLRQVIERTSAHDLRGQATVRLADFQFDRGRLVQAQGSIEAGPGFVSRSFLKAATQSLRLDCPGQVLREPDGMLPYDRLALEFRVDGAGLVIGGRAGGERDDAVLIDRETVLLIEPLTQPQPVTALARFLARPDDAVVSWPSGAPWLLSALPVRGQATAGPRSAQEETTATVEGPARATPRVEQARRRPGPSLR